MCLFQQEGHFSHPELWLIRRILGVPRGCTYEPYYVPATEPALIISMVQTWEPQLRKLAGDVRGDLPRGPRPPDSWARRDGGARGRRASGDPHLTVHLLRSRGTEGMTGNSVIRCMSFRQQLSARAASAPSPEGCLPSWGPMPSPADQAPRLCSRTQLPVSLQEDGCFPSPVDTPGRGSVRLTAVP